MNRHFKKVVLLLLAAGFIFGASRLQQSLNRDRDTLGLTRAAVLQNAPPALAFTTVALGGFRGLISNFLWMRANDLQQDDKFFEAAQLADWITDLEPTYAQVWCFQAWNMAYNISVKFKENGPGIYTDRWRWLKRGIELLRDQGLRYNPNSILIYRELGWFFQHKIGQNLDDGNIFYKMQWASEMKDFFGNRGTNFDRLVSPQTAADFQRLQVFTNTYKLDPAFVVAVNEKDGPFDWRLPEAHAIYWAEKGLDEVRKHPQKAKTDDEIMLRRVVYQSLLQSFHHGRIVSNPYSAPRLGPNLDLVSRVNWAYTNYYAEETDAVQTNGILTAHRNFLRDAVYFLYVANRMEEARQWFKYLGDRYPNKPIVENEPESLPKTLTLDEYAVAVVQIDIGETSQERVTSAIQGLLTQAYASLAMGEEDRYQTMLGLAQRVHEHYDRKTAGSNGNVRIPLASFDDLKKSVIRELLDPQVPYAARATLVTRLGLPASLLVSVAPDTNAAPATLAPGPTNSPATNSAGPARP